MSAEERLRRYLEQRRELGEKELILDGMTVDDVMKIIGASSAGAGRSPGSSGSQPASEKPRAGGTRSGGSGASRSEGEGKREDEGPSDWREALRAAGATGPESSAPRRAAPSSPGDEESRGTPPPRAPSTPDPANEQPAPAKGPAGVRSGIVVTPRLVDETPAPIAACRSLEEIAVLVGSCQRCDLYRTATHPVPGEGSPTARVMCVGEAPGAKEDATGRPFVGPAGELLTKILAAINLKRDDVFIANVLKHRPPGNRNPMPAEVEACSPYLVRQIELIRPAVIITFGAFAAQTLLETKLAIGKLRGAIHRYHGIPVVVTYHPAALLRNPAWKRPTWEDVQLARRILDSAGA